MAFDVTSVLAELLLRNRGPTPIDSVKRVPPNYGIAASLDGNHLDVVLTFRTQAAYCCMEPGCHLALSNGKRRESLRRGLDTHDIVVPARLQLRLLGVVEEGAMFFDLSSKQIGPGYYAFRSAAAFEYQISNTEAEAST